MYLDEAWVNQNYYRKYIWQNSEEGLKVPIGQGFRLIIYHDWSALGFKDFRINISMFIGDSDDYHNKINGHLFK